MINSPILLFAYKRLNVLIDTVECLKENLLSSESDLFIFSDAAKKEEDTKVVEAIRAYLHSVEGFKSVTILEAEQNKGLAKSIIDGVNFVMEKYDRVIVLEDDLKVTKNFLAFMNEGLEFYSKKSEVFSISGYNYSFPLENKKKYDNYFATRGCSWGWATWRDRWVKVNWNISTYDFSNSQLKSRMDDSGSDLYSMLRKQKEGKIDSWAIRWYYNQITSGGLTVYPVMSLVDNQGFDQDATHTKVYNRYRTFFMPEEKQEFYFDPRPAINIYYQRKIQRKFSILTRIVQGRVLTYLKHIKTSFRRVK